MDRTSRLWFGAVGVILIGLATGLVMAGMYQVIVSLIRWDASLNQRLLSAVGYVVIAVAVFDVAKYLIEEEVVRERELRQVGEVRRSLTRFTSTILIAVFLEAIVLIFKVSEEDLLSILRFCCWPALPCWSGLARSSALQPLRSARPASTTMWTTGQGPSALSLI